MNRISLHCSSFVAQPSGFDPHKGWDEFVDAVNAYYSPLESFADRFERLIVNIKQLGYDAVDIWDPGQLNWRWATDEHIRMARTVLERHNMAVTSYAGEFGATREEFLAACRVAQGIQTPLLSGTTTYLFEDRAFVVKTLKENSLQLAVENHPETSAREILDQIGDGGDGTIGTAVDTGWYATRGVDVVRAIQELGEHIIHIHLKDVLPGPEHINVGFGKGCVPLQACVQALKRMGYARDYSLENEGLDHDPSQELKTALALTQQWLA
jgi:sugar phosphate isomerase/epimerase